jgi:protein TonB
VFDDAKLGRRRERLIAASAVGAFHALLGYALVTSLGIDIADQAGQTLKLLDLSSEPPPPVEPPPPPPARQVDPPEAAAAPPDREAEASAVVAPPPERPIDIPPPIAAAPVAASGSQTSQGASALPGPGTGSGGEGIGSGSGGSGSGHGGGGAVTPARHIQGALSGRDYPRAAKRARAGGTVLVRYTVGTDGRVQGCTITQSSGNQDLDEVTCRLIERRFRYEPARDGLGRAVGDTLTGRHIWWTEPRRPNYPQEWDPEGADRKP